MMRCIKPFDPDLAKSPLVFLSRFYCILFYIRFSAIAHYQVQIGLTGGRNDNVEYFFFTADRQKLGDT